jgi:hypothetical protein
MFDFKPKAGPVLKLEKAKRRKVANVRTPILC